MEKLIDKLLGRPFMAADDKGGGDGAANPGAGDDKAGDKPTAADIAARAAGPAFTPAPKPAPADTSDGVDPETKPKPTASARPEHIPEKFWNAEKGEPRVDDLAKAYGTLEAAHQRMKQEKGPAGEVGDAPKDYLPEGIKLPDGVELDRVGEIPTNDPALEVFRAVAHKHKLPVGVAAGLAADFLAEMNGKLPAPQTEDDILAELGEGGKALRDELKVWMDGNYSNGAWSADELEWAYQTFGSSARGMRLLAKMREAAGEKRIPLGQPVGKDTPSMEEWYAMNRDPRMKTDEGFRARVEKLSEEIFGTDPAGTSPAVGVPGPRGFDRRERASTRG